MTAGFGIADDDTRRDSLPSSKVMIFSGRLSSSDDEVFGLEAADVVALGVGDGYVELDQNDLDVEAHGDRPGRGRLDEAI